MISSGTLHDERLDSTSLLHERAALRSIARSCRENALNRVQVLGRGNKGASKLPVT